MKRVLAAAGVAALMMFATVSAYAVEGGKGCGGGGCNAPSNATVLKKNAANAPAGGGCGGGGCNAPQSKNILKKNG